MDAQLPQPLNEVLIARRTGPPISSTGLVAPAGIGLLGCILLGLAARQPAPARRLSPNKADAARQMRQASAILAGSVLVDSAMEHFVGVYFNRAMYVAPAVAAGALTTALGGLRRLRRAVSGTAALTGLGGLGFHLYNIMKRPGGLSWHNLFYAAPFLAPGALTFSGILGLWSHRLERTRVRESGEAAHRTGRWLGLLTSGGLLATTAEAALLHFRGAYHDPFMFAPVSLPPAAAASLASAAARPTKKRIKLARGLLRATAWMGVIGVAFHVFGVGRGMGGWRNWTQTALAGPPVPAPPSFTAIALAGLGALELLAASGTPGCSPDERSEIREQQSRISLRSCGLRTVGERHG
jgi:hypothetical protein